MKELGERNTILIVDDAEINRMLLADILSSQYNILEASNGLEAMTLLNRYQSEISIVLLDIIMPEMDGFEVLQTMSRAGQLSDIPVIIISSETTPAFIDHAYALGATDVISRPFDANTVKRRVINTSILYSKQKQLKDMVTEQMLEKEKSNQIMVEVLSHIVEFRNVESGMHVVHMRVITETLLKQLVKIAPQYDLPLSTILLIANASAFHDIGKICIPESILNKPGRLTTEEYEIMKTHSAAGAALLESISYYNSEELVRTARDICRWHHERYDGHGYPDGLRGEEIPIAAQVVSLADVYDALTSPRVYKPAYSPQTAMEMICTGACGVFNPLLIQALQEAAPILQQELRDSSTARLTRNQVQDAAQVLLETGHTSNRSLSLLQQERTKTDFFTSLAKEILVELDCQSDLLTLTDWGAERLGLPPIIPHPSESEALAQVFAPEDFKDLRKRLLDATPEHPLVDKLYCLLAKGDRRWYRVIARPLWTSGTTEMTGMIAKFADVHDEQIRLEDLTRMPHYDSLTGLYSRDYASRLIVAALETARTQPYALLLLDLRDFREMNTQHGHAFGDRLLAEVARALRNSTRGGDILARAGGDEFMLFLRFTQDIAPVALRILSAINGLHPLGAPIRCSMGIALYPDHGTDYDTLLHHADQALYAAKNDNQSDYIYYDPTMDSQQSVISPIPSTTRPEKD